MLTTKQQRLKSAETIRSKAKMDARKMVKDGWLSVDALPGIDAEIDTITNFKDLMLLACTYKTTY